MKLENIKELENQITGSMFLMFLFFILSIYSILINNVIVTMILLGVTMMSFISARHIANRLHNNIQYEELRFIFSETQKDIKQIKINMRTVKNE